MSTDVELVVIGAGVIGLAIARAAARAGLETLVLESADRIGHETSSRNSEVIHAGIYYPSQSLKAQLCVAGKHQLYQFCEDYQVPFKRLGKLIVATQPNQEEKLESILAQAEQNGVTDLRKLSATEAHELEPNVKCTAALLSPSTGIIDSHAYMLALQGDLERHQGALALNTRVESLTYGSDCIEVHTDTTVLKAKQVINAAGLYADRLANQITPNVPTQYYAKGHYYQYNHGASQFSHLVYPVPEPGGLGIHLTLDIAGGMRFGPDVQWCDSIDYSFDESRQSQFLEAIKAYFPDVASERLSPGYCGIRPKLVGPNQPAADFLVLGPQQHGQAGLVHLLGIESPGLTASLALADYVLGHLDY